MFEDGCKALRKGKMFGEERASGDLISAEEMAGVSPVVLSALQSQGYIEDPSSEANTDDIKALVEQVSEIYEVLQNMSLQMAEINKRLDGSKPQAPKKGPGRPRKNPVKVAEGTA